jgi:hypothetical protein
MIRLRAGNRQGAGSTPGGYSETTAPDATIRRASSAWPRVVPVDPASEHSHRPSAALQGASVSLAVHASRQPAHYDEPNRRQLAGERPRHLGAVRGARARADDGDSGLRQRAAVPADEEVRRRIVQLREQGRIAGLAPGNSPNRVHVHEPSSVGDR